MTKSYNGQVERVNRTITPMLTKLSDNDIGKKWPNVISEIVFAVNNSIHKTTGESPYALIWD